MYPPPPGPNSGESGRERKERDQWTKRSHCPLHHPTYIHSYPQPSLLSIRLISPPRDPVGDMEVGRQEARNRVVVVGGGIAGALLVKSIQFHADVVLIDPKEYFEIPWANFRSKVEPTIAERTVINHNEYFTNGRVITSTAVNVTEKGVLTAEGRHVFYDYLVIATGHVHKTPRSRRDRVEQFQTDNQKIKHSESILIIGGGPTGVELAGELAIEYPDKKITLVHNGPRLLEFIGHKAGNKALDWLKSKKVEVLLGQSIDLSSMSESDTVYTTSTGETIKADCHFACVGKSVGSAWLQDSFLKDYIDKRGRLMVDEHLRVGGLSNIFAIGDITDVPELKQGFLAQRHSLVVARSLKLLIKGKEGKLAKYRPSPSLTMVSLGKKDAVAQLPIATFVGYVPGMFRSRDLFVGKTRKQMGLDRNP